MKSAVTLQALRDNKRALIGWSIGFLVFIGLELVVYPSIKNQTQLNDLIKDYPDQLKAFIGASGQLEITSPQGFLSTELFSFMVPLLVVFMAMSHASRAIAGEEDGHTLDLLLANPISRTNVVLQKAVALVVEILIVCAVIFFVIATGSALGSFGLAIGTIAAPMFCIGVLAMVFGAFAYMVSTATGRRGMGLGVVAAFAVGSYVINSLAITVKAIRPVGKLSPFHYANPADAMANGVDVLALIVLIVISFVVVVLTALLFNRRDLSR